MKLVQVISPKTFPVLLLWLIGSTAWAEQPAPVGANHAENMAAGIKLFKEQVRSTLVHSCLHCHGGDSIESGFDLTTRESMLQGGDYEEPILDFENAEASWLYRLLNHEEEPTMPEEASKLKPDKLAAIKRWIELGAPYDKPLIDPTATRTPWTERKIAEEDRDYWAFQPLHQVAPPKLANDDWSRTPIDQFVLAKLREKKLTANPPAARRKLIRRAYFDLLGLPPTPAEVDRFVADQDPQAYEKLVDRLLASPHYGERWARHWMDVARFAESEGGEHDYNRGNAYHYRDFLIQAFNQDMPYDQFVRWQVAGDEFAPDNPLAMTATGFLVAGTFPTQLTEREFEQARYDQLDDMAGTTGMAFLGLTVSCARCHDHKFDPIPARDYYRMVSSFSRTIRSEVNVAQDPAALRMAQAKVDAEVAEHKKALATFEQQVVPKRFAQYVASLATQETSKTSWAILDLSESTTQQGTKLTPLPDGSLLASGAIPAKDAYTLVAETPQAQVTGIRLEALTHASLPKRGPGLARNGNFCLSNIHVTAEPLSGGGSPVPVKLVAPRATHQQNDNSLSALASLDSDPGNTGWAIDFGGIGKDQAAVFAFAEPVHFAGGVRLNVVLQFNHFNGQHAIGRPRLAVTSEDAKTVEIRNAQQADQPALVAETLARLAQQKRVPRTARQRAVNWFQSTLPEWQKLAAAVTAAEKARPSVAQMRVQVGSEGVAKLKHHANGRGYPHFYPKSFFLKRGDPNQKQGDATPGFLQVLMRGGKDETYWHQTPPSGSRTSYRRRAMADWLTDVEYGAGPLTARVMVNRLWSHHFGRGIVETPNDFGHQAPPPTHPELLEWLARQLVDHGWRLKSLHKLMMTSAVYMQNAAYDDERAGTDPENQFYWRRSVQRLEAEAIRDAMLSVSGQLDPMLYGPGQSSAAMKRRSVYFFLKRSRMPAALQLFDLPEPLVSQGRRPATIVAPQALRLMNSPLVQANAKALAERLVGRAPADAVREGYRLAVARAPTEQELSASTQYIESQTAAYQKQQIPDAKAVALADFCQTLFCLNEFIYLD